MDSVSNTTAPAPKPNDNIGDMSIDPKSTRSFVFNFLRTQYAKYFGKMNDAQIKAYLANMSVTDVSGNDVKAKFIAFLNGQTDFLGFRAKVNLKTPK